MVLTVRIEKHDERILAEFIRRNKLNRTQAVKELLHRGFIISQLQDYQDGKITLGRMAELLEVSIVETLDLVSKYNAHPRMPRDYVTDARINAGELKVKSCKSI